MFENDQYYVVTAMLGKPSLKVASSAGPFETCFEPIKCTSIRNTSATKIILMSRGYDLPKI